MERVGRAKVIATEIATAYQGSFAILIGGGEMTFVKQVWYFF